MNPHNGGDMDATSALPPIEQAAFGLCPTCHGAPTVVHVAVSPGSYRTDQWATCETCRTRWFLGDPMSYPDFAPPPASNLVEAGIAGFRAVEPYYPARYRARWRWKR